MLCMRQVCGSRSIFSASPKHTAKTNAPSLYLIKNGLVDFVGTDIHNPRHISAINDYLTTKNAYSDMDALRGVIRNDIAFN